MFDELSASLSEADIPFEENVPLSEHTTLRVGGPASLFVRISSALQLRQAAMLAAAAGVPVVVLGQGSNVLVRDGGIRAAVVHLGADLSGIEMLRDGVIAQAGARLGQVAAAAQAAGLSGLEPIAGVPGTVGGAIAMNAGCYGLEIAERVEWAEVLCGDGTARRVDAGALAFGYRRSAVKESGWIVTRAKLRLFSDDPAAIRARMRDFAERRREKQPLNLPSAGSFFKRPEGCFAGALIEQAGLKGFTAGGAQVSRMHAGFLVNVGNATATDFIRLMRHVQDAVYRQSGILLEPEVQIIGCDSSC